MNPKMRDELIRDEGTRLEAYQDSVGLWTIGIGHLLGTEKRMTRITQAEADALFEADVKAAHRLACTAVPWLDYTFWGSDPRERVIVNMAFNLGPRLLEFKKFLAAFKAGHWDVAAVEMMDSKWATQVGARAERLRDMLL